MQVHSRHTPVGAGGAAVPAAVLRPAAATRAAAKAAPGLTGGELADMLALAAADPAAWPPAALAARTGLPEADVAALLRFHELPALRPKLRP